MRLSMMSWIIKAEVCVICRSRRLRQIIQTWGFDNSWYHAKTEFNNCFIIHFLNNRQKKTFICWKMTVGSFGIDWYIREDLRYSNYWFAADITTVKLTVNNSLRASSPGRSGSGAGKGRRACNYISRIWISALKKPSKNVDWRGWHY